jgi:hypothetical protein
MEDSDHCSLTTEQRRYERLAATSHNLPYLPYASDGLTVLWLAEIHVPSWSCSM